MLSEFIFSCFLTSHLTPSKSKTSQVQGHQLQALVQRRHIIYKWKGGRGEGVFISSLGCQKQVLCFILPVSLERNTEPGRVGIEELILSLIRLKAERWSWPSPKSMLNWDETWEVTQFLSHLKNHSVSYQLLFLQSLESITLNKPDKSTRSDVYLLKCWR